MKNSPETIPAEETPEERKRRDHRARVRRWRLANPDKRRAYLLRNKDKTAGYVKKALAKIMTDPAAKEEKNRKHREWVDKNREHVRAKKREDRAKNMGKYRIYAAKTRAKTKDICRERGRKWREKYPERNTANSARSRAERFNATPAWVRDDELKPFYKEAVERAKITGEKHEVDHIVPINGKVVCGLHVPWNLRVVTFKENRSKHCRFDERDGLHPTLANGLLSILPP